MLNAALSHFSSSPVPFNAFIQRWVEESVVPEDRQLVLEKMAPERFHELFEKGKMEDDLEYRLVSDGKHPMFIKQNIILTKDERTGNVLGLLIAKDVTEARLKESLYTQALKDACESANQANRQKVIFVQHVTRYPHSHERYRRHDGNRQSECA